MHAPQFSAAMQLRKHLSRIEQHGGIEGALDALLMGEIHLVEHLKRRRFLLFDIQMLTPITAQLGGATIARTQYLKRLAAAVERTCSF